MVSIISPLAAATLIFTPVKIGSLPLYDRARPEIHSHEMQRLVLLDNYALNRAKNLAREAAEKANGGLNNYRSEASMYGPAVNSPYVNNGKSWTFTFFGHRPDSVTPTIESIVTVAKNGSQVTVDYNGPIVDRIN